jgi:hypothetical protein
MPSLTGETPCFAKSAPLVVFLKKAATNVAIIPNKEKELEAMLPLTL